jgi:hypothetical protein
MKYNIFILRNDFAKGGLNMKATITAERITLKSSEYNVVGSVMELPLSGSGVCNIDFSKFKLMRVN